MDAFLAEVTRLAPNSGASNCARKLHRIDEAHWRKHIAAVLARFCVPWSGVPRLTWTSGRRSASVGSSLAGRSRARLSARELNAESFEVISVLMLCSMCFMAPLYHCMFVPYEGGTLSDTYIDALIDAVFNGLVRRSRKPQQENEGPKP